MNIQEILSAVDHTLLNPAATLREIIDICDDGIKYGTASVCIPASFVKQAAEYARGRVRICTVVGFPTGYSTTAVKCYETETAVKDGADEIDMVINIGWLKEKRNADILKEINAVKKACQDKILKVIIETCLLTEEEKIQMCHIVSESNADFIKTSTGFSTAGATKEDIALFKGHCAPHIKIKAAGGISNIDDAKDFINLGAHRLGTSRVVKQIKEQNLL